MLPTEEPVWFATLSPFSCSTLVRPRSLRTSTPAVLPTCSICAIATKPPLSCPNERGTRISAEVDLPRDHLLHGEVAGGHAELLEFQPALLKKSRAQQVVGWH